MWGEEIRRAREALSWSQAELARTLGVSSRTVIRWEQNQTVPTPTALQTLANVTGSPLHLTFEPRKALDPDRRCVCGRVLPPRRRKWCSDRCRAS